MAPRGGYTLIEIATVLTLLGLLLAAAAPGVRRWRDEVAVRVARDEVAASAALARITAMGRGGASLVLDPVSGRVGIRTGSEPWSRVVELRERYGVQVDAGSAAAVEIRYDGLGIGRLGNRTVTLRRGRAVVGLTVSAYGRVRRW